MRRAIALVMAALLASTSNAAGQSVGRMIGYDVLHAGGDEGCDATDETG